MKKYLFILAVVFWGMNGIAQKISYGPTVGLNFTTLSFSDKVATVEDGYTYSTRNADAGIVAGGFFAVHLGNFTIQQQLLYSQKKTDLLLKSPTLEQKQTLTFNYIQIPVTLALNTKDGFIFSGGPVFSTMIDGSIIPSRPNNWKLSNCSYGKTSVGMQLGLGYTINRVGLNVLFENNISKMGVQMVSGINSFAFDYNTRSIRTTFSYRISKL